jgi:hypothetical protein
VNDIGRASIGTPIFKLVARREPGDQSRGVRSRAGQQCLPGCAALPAGPSAVLQATTGDLKKLRIATRRVEIERAADAGFGHRSRHKTVAMHTMTLEENAYALQPRSKEINSTKL